MYLRHKQTAGWLPAPQTVPAMPEPLLPLRSEAPFSFFYVSFPVPTSFLLPPCYLTALSVSKVPTRE